MIHYDLIDSARGINQLFRDRSGVLPSIETRRTNLPGILMDLNRLSDTAIKDFSNGRPLAAVDGSRVDYGELYPYTICLMQALACSTQDGIELSRAGIISPMAAETNESIQKIMYERGMEEQEAYRRHLRESLARVELELAIDIIHKCGPFLLMLDGGFLLFDRFPEWTALVDSAQKSGCILTGVIEEVATAELYSRSEFQTASQRVYDREYLFGVLNQGECLVMGNDQAIKRDYTTVFTRMGSVPQVIAFDFLAGQSGVIDKAMDFAYSLTPGQGRGIPAWLDMVDRRVRLSRKNVANLLFNTLEPSLREKYLNPNRNRRGL
ncbi:MAG: DNA double-strand break repair nuclease NurA [Chitinophagales bacterium]